MFPTLFAVFFLSAACLGYHQRMYVKPPLRKYPISKHNNAWYVQKFNSKNATEFLPHNVDEDEDEDEDEDDNVEQEEDPVGAFLKTLGSNTSRTGVRFVVKKNMVYNVFTTSPGSNMTWIYLVDRCVVR